MDRLRVDYGNDDLRLPVVGGPLRAALSYVIKTFGWIESSNITLSKQLRSIVHHAVIFPVGIWGAFRATSSSSTV